MSNFKKSEKRLPKIGMVLDGGYLFVVQDGIKIAKRDWAEGGQWISLEQGYRVFNAADGSVKIEPSRALH